MSRADETVSMYGSTSACLAPQDSAKERTRSRLARSVASSMGTESGRAGLKCPAAQSRAGSLLPTPRGSKPITSYWAATSLGRAEAMYPARLRPLPPGPPGLTSSGPWEVGPVWGTRVRARVIWRPSGRAWSRGTLRDAHCSVGYRGVVQPVQRSAACAGACAGACAAGSAGAAGAAVTGLASAAATVEIDSRTAARFFKGWSMGPPSRGFWAESSRKPRLEGGIGPPIGPM